MLDLEYLKVKRVYYAQAIKMSDITKVNLPSTQIPTFIEIKICKEQLIGLKALSLESPQSCNS